MVSQPHRPEGSAGQRESQFFLRIVQERRSPRRSKGYIGISIGHAKKLGRVSPFLLDHVTREFVQTTDGILLNFPFVHEVIELGGEHRLQEVLPVGHDDSVSVDGVGSIGIRMDLLDRQDLDDGG